MTRQREIEARLENAFAHPMLAHHQDVKNWIDFYADDICWLLERVKALEDIYRHDHAARYFKNADGRMELTDACDKCGLDIRDSIHSKKESA